MTTDKYSRQDVSQIETEEDNIPLRMALAAFMSDDPRQNYAKIDAISDKICQRFMPWAIGKYLATFVFFSLLTSVVMVNIAAVFLPSSVANWLPDLLLPLFCLTIAPFFFWYVYEYGLQQRSRPLPTPYDSDQSIDAFLEFFQKEPIAKELGIRAYYYSVADQTRFYVDRRQFFGKLRYLLFSDRVAAKYIVTRFLGGTPVLSPIFISRADLGKIITTQKPRRTNNGQGRPPKYTYADAIVDMIGDERLLSLSLKDEFGETGRIVNWLKEWFSDHADESGDMPSDQLIRPYAKKIYNRMIILRSARPK